MGALRDHNLMGMSLLILISSVVVFDFVRGASMTFGMLYIEPKQKYNILRFMLLLVCVFFIVIGVDAVINYFLTV